MSEENKATIFRRVWEAWFKGDESLLDKYYDPNVIDHEAIPGQPPGLEGLKYHARVFRNAFSDNRWTVESEIEEGDFLVVRWTMTRRHSGEFMGIPPTGKEVTWTGT